MALVGHEVRGLDGLGDDARAVGAPLRIEGLRMRFAADGPEVLRGVDLGVGRGEIVAVLGANGCGKSTMLRCAIRLLDPTGGQILLGGRDVASLDGHELRAARRRAAVVFQNIALVGRKSAFENVCLGGIGALGLRRSFHASAFPAELRGRAAAALARVGLVEKAWQHASTLSGGQAQRVAIARAVCQEPSIILADEPVSALDPRAAEDVLALLASLAHDDGLGVLVVLHQPELALAHADRVVGMVAGEVAFDRPPSEVSAEDVAALYAGQDDAREAA
jgi:phosphonate transport system ATP-binding protein